MPSAPTSSRKSHQHLTLCGGGKPWHQQVRFNSDYISVFFHSSIIIFIQPSRLQHILIPNQSCFQISHLLPFLVLVFVSVATSFFCLQDGCTHSDSISACFPLICIRKPNGAARSFRLQTSSKLCRSRRLIFIWCWIWAVFE